LKQTTKMRIIVVFTILLVTLMLSYTELHNKSYIRASNNHHEYPNTIVHTSSLTTKSKESKIQHAATTTIDHKDKAKMLKELERRAELSFMNDKAWINNTIRLLRLGRYKGFDESLLTPSLYATYHYIASLALFNMYPRNVNKTLNYLYAMNKKYFNDKNTPLPLITKIFYGVESIKLLGYEPEYKEILIDKILSYMNNDGSWGNSSELVFTYYAIKALRDLGYNVTKLNKTRRFIRLELRGLLISLNKDDVSAVALAFRIAELLGINPTSFPEYKGFLKQLKNLKVELLRGNLDKELYLSQLRDLTYLLFKAHLLDHKVKLVILESLKRWKKGDGGFSELADYGTPIGTHNAMEIYKMLNSTPPKTVIRFIYMHELPDGGFVNDMNYNSNLDMCSIADVAYIARVLGVSKEARDYIARYINSWLHFVEQNYKPSLLTLNRLSCLVEAANDIGIRLSTNQLLLVKNLLQNTIIHMASMQGGDELIIYVYPIARILNKINLTIPKQIRKKIISALLSSRNPDGSFGSGHRLDLTAIAVIDLHELGYNYRDNTTISFIRGAQLPNGGFTMRIANRVYNMSLMPLTYLAVKALYEMNTTPANTSALINWLISCKHKEGGISLFPGSSEVSDATTYWGLKILEIIRQMGVTR